jgi:hypothetical protein
MGSSNREMSICLRISGISAKHYKPDEYANCQTCVAKQIMCDEGAVNPLFLEFQQMASGRMLSSSRDGPTGGKPSAPGDLSAAA